MTENFVNISKVSSVFNYFNQEIAVVFIEQINFRFAKIYDKILGQLIFAKE